MLQKGLLIAVEGIDGAGKSTLAHTLNLALIAHGFKTLLTKEPGGSRLGSHLRSFLQEQDIAITAKAEYLLFAADRAQHIAQIIEPALLEKKIVISDRLSDSSIVYQGYGRDVSIEHIKNINDWVMNGHKADITIYLKIPPAEAHKRLISRGKKLTNFEQESSLFVERLAYGFEQLYANRSDVITLDGLYSVEDSAHQAHQMVMHKINQLQGS
jgi:dTMP kinase